MQIHKTFYWTFIAILSVALFSCKGKSPEDLPKFKKKFRAQIASFENEKKKASLRSLLTPMCPSGKRKKS